MYSASNTISTADHLANHLHYIGDPTHPDHAEIEIGPEMTIGMGQVPRRDFVASWERRFAEEQSTVRPGRKRTRLAVAEVIRTPYHAHVTDEEEAFLLHRIHARLGGAAIMRRHRHRGTGATDWHIVRFKEWHRTERPLSLLRQASDDAHAELNELRQKQGAPRIETMMEVRRRRKKEKGFSELAEQLLSVGAVTAANIKQAIEKLGHMVTRFNPKKGTISVLHPDGKKAFRYSIAELLERMATLRREGIVALAPGTSTPASGSKAR